MSKAPSKTFTATFQGTGPNQRVPFCDLPFDSEALFGSKGRIPVEVKLNGATLRMALPPKGKQENHQLSFNQSTAREAGVGIGQTARITITLDTAPRTSWLPKLKPVVGTATLWIAYPKRTFGVKTDLTRDRGWEPVEALGLGPIQQVAVDDTWSALRFNPMT